MKLGVFQSACAGLGINERFERLGRSVSGQQLDLIVCPELFASGYNAGDQLLELADQIGGNHFQTASQIARAHRTAIVYGYPERVGDTIHNSAAFVSADGELIANHRKRANSPGSFEEKYFTPGENDPTLVDVSGVQVGVLICYEVEFPETVRQLARIGAQLVVVPTALVDAWPVVAEKLVPTRAFENGVWLAYANHGGQENGFTYLGGSRIVSPDGREQAVAGMGEELIVVDIDVSLVAPAQNRLPYLRDCIRFTDRLADMGPP